MNVKNVPNIVGEKIGMAGHMAGNLAGQMAAAKWPAIWPAREIFSPYVLWWPPSKWPAIMCLLEINGGCLSKLCNDSCEEETILEYFDAARRPYLARVHMNAYAAGAAAAAAAASAAVAAAGAVAVAATAAFSRKLHPKSRSPGG